MANHSRRVPRLAFTAAGAAAVLLVTGCSTAAAPAEGGAASGDAIELTVWNNIDYEPYQGLQKGYFEECAEELGITVNVETVTGEYNAKLLQAASSNTLPDVALVSTDVSLPQLASQGVLTDLGSVGVTTDGLSDVVAGLGTYEDTLVGLPVQVEDYAVFYDQAALAEAGIAEFPSTFAGLVETTTALTNADRYGIVLPGISGDGSTAVYFLPFLLSAGGDPADPTSEGAVAAVDLYAQLVKAGALSKEFVTWGWDSIGQWTSGTAAVTVSGPWNLVDSSLEVDYATAPFPTVAEGDAPVVNLLGYSYAVPVQADAARTQAAADLITCRASEENQIETALKGGYIPALTSAQEAFVAEVPAAASFVDAIPDAFNAASLGTEWNTLQQVYIDAIQDAAINGTPAADALAAAVAANQ